MAKSASKNKETALLSALASSTSTPTPTPEPADATIATEEKPTASRPSQGIAERAIITLYPQDRKLIRELQAYLSTQEIQASASLVIKSLLRAVKPGPELIRACREVQKLDRRVKYPRA